MSWFVLVSTLSGKFGVESATLLRQLQRAGMPAGGVIAELRPIACQVPYVFYVPFQV